MQLILMAGIVVGSEAGRQGAEMPLNPVERRKMPRLPLEVLVRIKLPSTSSEIFGETRNVSAGGIYFVTRSDRLEAGQELDCLLILPEKLTMAPAPVLVAARGKVLRIHHEPAEERFGIALEVYSYDFSGKGENSSHAVGF